MIVPVLDYKKPDEVINQLVGLKVWKQVIIKDIFYL